MWYGVLKPDNRHPCYLCYGPSGPDEIMVSDSMFDADGFPSLKAVAISAKLIGWNPPKTAHVRFGVQVTRNKPGVFDPL